MNNDVLTTDVHSATGRFRAMRDFLLEHREDYAGALGDFALAGARALQLGARLVRRDRPTGNDRPRCGSSRRTAARPAGPSPSCPRAPNQVANWLRAPGVRARRPDHPHARQPGRAVGDDAGRDEAAARSSSPPPPLLGPADLRDRVERGRGAPRRRRAPRDAAKFDDVPGDYTRIAVGRARRAGWLRLRRRATPRAGDFTPDGADPRRRPAAALLHLGHHRPAQAGRAHPRLATRSATCRRCTGSGCGPATCTSTSPRPAGPSTPGATSSRPWNAEATRVHLQLHALRRRPRCWTQMDRCGVTTLLRAADGLADAHPGRPGRAAHARRARWSAPASRSTPR